MSTKDLLGNRMKSNYENRYRFSLTRKTPVIIRIDGKSFHTYTRGFNKPWDHLLINTMLDTARYLCDEVMGCKLAYVQSDEISLLLTDYDRLESEAWFDNNLQKICSVSASIATMAFNMRFGERVALEAENNPVKSEQILSSNFETIHKNHVDKIGKAIFDARAFNIPESEVCNYFIWRQQDAIRNSIEMLGHYYFSQKEMHKKNCNEIIEMIIDQENIDWHNLPALLKYGGCVKRKPSDSKRLKWAIDTNIPIFTLDRNYIEDLLKAKDNEK